jgi:hypothetical protein
VNCRSQGCIRGADPRENGTRGRTFTAHQAPFRWAGGVSRCGWSEGNHGSHNSNGVPSHPVARRTDSRGRRVRLAERGDRHDDPAGRLHCTYSARSRSSSGNASENASAPAWHAPERTGGDLGATGDSLALRCACRPHGASGSDSVGVSKSTAARRLASGHLPAGTNPL